MAVVSESDRPSHMARVSTLNYLPLRTPFPMSETRVFIVDDDVASAASLQALMMAVGIRADVFHSAESFLEAYDRQRPGCLLLDIRLGGMSGLELQKELVSSRAPLAIVMISGHADDADRCQAKSSGAIAFLAKPVDARELCDIVRSAISHEATTMVGSKPISSI